MSDLSFMSRPPEDAILRSAQEYEWFVGLRYVDVFCESTGNKSFPLFRLVLLMSSVVEMLCCTEVIRPLTRIE